MRSSLRRPWRLQLSGIPDRKASGLKGDAVCCDVANPACGKADKIRSTIFAAAVLISFAAVAPLGSCQSNPDLQTFFRQDIGLSSDQIAAIQKGEPVAKNLPS